MKASKDILTLDEAYFGPFWKYVADDNVTDTDFNGTDLWITDSANRRTKITDHGITPAFVESFSQRVANQVNKQFNKRVNLLEAETETLRISILHESAAVSGRSICLRKSLPKVRLTASGILADNYMPRPIMNLVANCIRAKMNMVIGGEPGAGKDLVDSTLVPVPISDTYPSGWARHGDLKPCDKVFTRDGQIAIVDYVTPGRNLNVYKVTFSDGQVIKASDTHLWNVADVATRRGDGVSKEVTKENKEKARLLREVATSDTFVVENGDVEYLAKVMVEPEDRVNAFLAQRRPALGNTDTWPVDETMLAYADYLEGRPVLQTLETKELATSVLADNGCPQYAVPIAKAFDCPHATLPGDPYEVGQHCFTDVGIQRSIDKCYLRASKGQRLAFLQGLMDSKGRVLKTGCCSLTCRDRLLAEQVLELVRSLGMKAYLKKKEAGFGITFWTTDRVFTKPELLEQLPKVLDPRHCWNEIISVRKVDPEQGRCIHVNHPEHLYLAGGFIPTHNTEVAKFFTQFVKEDQRVITIEDSPEWHYHIINPQHDCVEMRVNPDFTYADAIKTCLRQNPKWIMLSEARSVEVKYLLEAWSTGVNGVTTIHTDDVRKIASRLLNMLPSREDADRMENDIYDFVNVVMLVRRKAQPDGSSHRYIDQMGFLYREQKENKIQMLVKNGVLISDTIPADLAFRLERDEITAPFESSLIDDLVGDSFAYVPLEVAAPPEPVAALPVEPPVKAKPVDMEFWRLAKKLKRELSVIQDTTADPETQTNAMLRARMLLDVCVCREELSSLVTSHMTPAKEIAIATPLGYDLAGAVAFVDAMLLAYPKPATASGKPATPRKPRASVSPVGVLPKRRPPAKTKPLGNERTATTEAAVVNAPPQPTTTEREGTSE